MQHENESEKLGKLSSVKKTSTLLRIIAIATIFGAGFFTHATFFPDTSIQTMILFGEYIIGTKSPSMPTETGEKEKPAEIVELIKKVDYNNGSFSPSTVRVHYGNYISIENKSNDELMWLSSNMKELSTPRGYALSEKLQNVLLKEGTYLVENKLNPSAKLTVVVYR